MTQGSAGTHNASTVGDGGGTTSDEGASGMHAESQVNGGSWIDVSMPGGSRAGYTSLQ